VSDAEELLARAPRWLTQGNPGRLEQDMRALCTREPRHARAHFLRGVALHLLGRIDEAIAAFDTSLVLEPRDAQALCARAGMLHRLGDVAAAEQGFLAALAVAPRDAEIVTNLALVHEDQGRDAQALAGYERALALQPHSVRALQNRAALLARRGQLVPATQACHAWLRVAPDAAAAHASLANLLLARARFAEALESASRALQLDSRHARAQADAALALAALGRFDDYRAAARRAHALQPGILRTPDSDAPGTDIPDPRVVYLITAHQRLTHADWHDFERHGEVFCEVADDTALRATLPDLMGLLFRSYVWPVPPEARTRLARRCAAQVHARAVPRLWLSDVGRDDDRLRVGYLSGDFRLHPAAKALWSVLSNHDRRRFQVTAYVLNRDDGSGARQRLLEAVDAVVHLADVDDHEAAWRIRERGCDLLVYRDGFTYGTRPGILAQHPAPLQLTWAGYHGTLGRGLNDYHVSEPLSDPPEESHLWDEARLFLPYGPLSFPHAAFAVPEPPLPRQRFGLPATGIVYAAMHRVEKIDPELFACWMRLLHAVPDAVLWLLEGAPEVPDRLRAHALAHGIDPRRLVFAPYAAPDAHLDRLALADIWLDTRWFGSHITLHDALAAGVPAISCPGNAVPGRIGRAILHAAGLPELVCASLDEYRRIGIRLAHDAPARDAIRARLRRRDAPLFDAVAFTRSLESGYEQIWQRHRDGLPPCDLHVSAHAYRAPGTAPPASL
jgi:predicted O-linked N-acetylglucosamine transferase (SPINDLY family)